MAKRWTNAEGVNASDLNNSVVPTGALSVWGTATAPDKWVLCDGASYVRTGAYADLFAVIGTTYGSADGSHFNVPDLRGRIGVGISATDTEFDALAETGGTKTHQLSVAELPAHHHHINAVGSGVYDGNVGNCESNPSEHTTDSKGSDTAHNNIQPYITMNFIIKL